MGRKLVPLIASSQPYHKVVIVHRGPTPFARLAKIEERVIDFGQIPALAVEGVDAVFCCVVTTQKLAGSTGALQRVDRDIPVALAAWAAEHQAGTFVTISSLGADVRSGSVYLRTKGEMEEASPLPTSLRPSLLKGERREFRLAERVGNRALAIVGPLMVGPLRTYRAVSTEAVAKAMLVCAQRSEPGLHILESDAIQDLGTWVASPPDRPRGTADP